VLLNQRDCILTGRRELPLMACLLQRINKQWPEVCLLREKKDVRVNSMRLQSTIDFR